MGTVMVVLGFDTATPATVVGLRLADGTTLQACDDPPAGQRPGHATRLLPLASELLAQAGLQWAQLERIAVGAGPGTFTGLRIGVATARGLAQSLGVEVVGVSTLRVLAEAALRAPDAEWPQPQTGGGAQVSKRGVLAAVDARRGEAFVAVYAGGREVAAPHALRPEDLGSLPVGSVKGLGNRPRRVVGGTGGLPLGSVGGPGSLSVSSPNGLEWLAVGDGAVRFRGYVEALGVAVAEGSSPLHRVDAGVLCELALDAPAGALEAVLPDYRRLPDAEIALEKSAGA
jgi:tRNA threonylcarbamoyladenosine biosynthesis protein TsaB